MEHANIWIPQIIHLLIAMWPPYALISLSVAISAWFSRLSYVCKVHSKMPGTYKHSKGYVSFFPVLLTQHIGASYMTSLSFYQMWWQKPTNMIIQRPQDRQAGISRVLSEERSWNKSPQILRHYRKTPLEWDRRSMIARNVGSLSGKKVASHCMRESTLVRSLLSAPSVERASGPKAI